MAKMHSKLAADLAAQVVGAAAHAVGSAYGLPGLGQLAETLVRGLLQVQDEMAESLSRIEQNLQLLVDAPWNTARVYLEECLIPNRTPAQIAASLNKAAELLREALASQPPGTMSMAYVALDLAIVLMMLNDREASIYYAQIAIEAGTKYAIGFAEKATSNQRSTAEGRKQAGVTATHWYWLARAVDPIFGQWPMDQFDMIRHASGGLYTDVRNIAIEAFNRGEGGPEWVPPLAAERKRWEAYEDEGLWD